MEVLFDVTFREEYDTDKGPKWRKCVWLVRALSPTDAEAKVTAILRGYGNNFEVDGAIKNKKYEKVLEDDN